MNVGSLFSGIGGLDLGLERAGMSVRWQCEIDPYCRAVLAHHWPGIKCYQDIKDLNGDAERVDLICGGFPCQDISSAHSRTSKKGLRGDKSGLWEEFRRVIHGIRPTWVLVENSPQWRSWVPEVRIDLEEMHYGSTAFELAAGKIGAPHIRKRVFVVANSNSDSESIGTVHAETQIMPFLPGDRQFYWGQAPPRGFRVADGLPGRVDRLRALGNAVVPQVAEAVGRMILAAES